MIDRPKVSVIITTVDRPQVRDAVLSALNQTLPPLEVILAIDRADGVVPEAVTDLLDQIRIVFSGGGGSNAARMLAFSESRGDFIAFLDDDDFWLPEKLESQLTFMREAPTAEHVILSCRFRIVTAGQSTGIIMPSKLYEKGDRVAAYLFRRSRVRHGEGALHTSTLMCDRELLSLEPWDTSLRLHTDWDWSLRVGDRGDTAIAMVPDVLVVVSNSDRRSVSLSGNWRVSMTWARARRDKLTLRELGDFLLSHTAPLATRSGDRRGALKVAWVAAREGRPGPYAWMVWAVHLLPPNLFELASEIARRVSSVEVDPHS